MPDYDVGFVILAADSDTNPDLNAYADLIATEMIPALEQNSIVAASKSYAGTYISATNMSIVIQQAEDSSPGLSLTGFHWGSKDIRATYAEMNNIAPKNLSFRLYPTNVVKQTDNKRKMVFRASFQDVTALADAGTPTCETWRYVDDFQVNGVSLDAFVFEIEDDRVVSVEVPALNVTLAKAAAV